MTAPEPADPGAPRLPTEPTIKVARPPVPGTTKPDEPPAERPAAGGHPGDEPTITLPDRAAAVRAPTLRFGRPAPVKVTVTARPRRPHRTWPWILAVAIALAVLGVVLLVMLIHGATLSP
jgi:hypothetical protein